jgi:hypothetical protein
MDFNSGGRAIRSERRYDTESFSERDMDGLHYIIGIDLSTTYGCSLARCED